MSEEKSYRNTIGNYYIGLDIGTDSVGWAVSDTEYNIPKFKGNSMWGIRLLTKLKMLWSGAVRERQEGDWRGENIVCSFLKCCLRKRYPKQTPHFL